MTLHGLVLLSGFKNPGLHVTKAPLRHIVTTLLCLLLIFILLLQYNIPMSKEKPADLRYLSQHAETSKFIPTPQN